MEISSIFLTSRDGLGNYPQMSIVTNFTFNTKLIFRNYWSIFPKCFPQLHQFWCKTRGCKMFFCLCRWRRGGGTPSTFTHGHPSHSYVIDFRLSVLLGSRGFAHLYRNGVTPVGMSNSPYYPYPYTNTSPPYLVFVNMLPYDIKSMCQKHSK